VTATQRDVLVILLVFAIGLLALACGSTKPVDDAMVGDRIRQIHIRDARTGRCIALTWIGGVLEQGKVSFRVAEDRFCEGPRP
jgi:hypothetical protein